LAPGETAPFRHWSAAGRHFWRRVHRGFMAWNIRGLVLVLYALSCIVFAASQWLEHRKVLGKVVLVASLG